MPDRNLQFEELSVHQARGIRHGDGFKLEDLAGCINIIHGRNGSGKSTTALVIHELLWPGKTELERPSVSGVLREDERAWDVLVEPGHREWRLNGTVESGPEFGPPEIRRRYRLALEELVAGEDEHFAKEIADATQGGFDLEAAVGKAAFSKVPPPRRNAAAAAREAEDKWRAASDRQRKIQYEEGRRAALLLEAEAAKRAHERLPQLERARELREAGLQAEALRQRLDTFPPEIGRLRGDEREELDRLHSQITDGAENRRAAERKITAAKEVQTRLRIADSGAAETLCERLKAGLPRLQRLENTIEQEQRAASQARGEAAELRQRLGKDFDEKQIGNLSAVQFPELSDFARKVIDHLAAHRVNEERLGALNDAADQDLPGQSYEQIHAGIRSLREWLAGPEPLDREAFLRLLPVIGSLVVVVALSVTLGVVHHPGWYAGLLTAAGLGFWEWRQLQLRAGGNPGGARPVHEADYNRSGLPALESWNPDAVGDRLRELTDLAVRRRGEDQRQRELATVQKQSERLRQEAEELKRMRDELATRLGPKVEISDEWLPRFIDNLTVWQQKCTAVSGHEQTVADLRQQQTELLGQLNTDFVAVGFTEIDSSEAAGLAINALEAQLTKRREAIRDEEEARRELQRAEVQIRDAETDLEKIHGRLGVTRETEAQVDGWLARRGEYLRALSDLQNAEAVRNQRQRDLADAPPVDDSDIDQQIAEAEELAGRWEELRDEITTIQVRIENAKSGHELSDALEERERTLQELRDIQEYHLQRAAGRHLADWVRRKSAQGARPQVFNRAKELFRKFTNNRLQLDMDERSVPPRFLARRSETSADPVANLSVGERMQLLIAVRLAFIELNETIRLPLLLDEVLGTSDDERAAAIIDTVITIAREGRQVFYFTAQLDEVGKWLSRLGETATAHKVIDLDHVRSNTAPPKRPIPTTPVQFMPPPRPTGNDHAEYGRQLRVSLFDPWDESSVGLHLWHVIDDVQLLYRMLRKQVTSWWQLKQMPEAEREKLFPGSAPQCARAKAAAKAIETACRTWRIGRGKPVNRDVLFSSGVVTDRFLDSVVKLAEQQNGHAAGIITGLKHRYVSGWRNAKTDELFSYFKTHGHLVDSRPQTRRDIESRVLAAMTEELQKELIERQRIIQIVNSLPDLDD